MSRARLKTVFLPHDRKYRANETDISLPDVQKLASRLRSGQSLPIYVNHEYGEESCGQLVDLYHDVSHGRIDGYLDIHATARHNPIEMIQKGQIKTVSIGHSVDADNVGGDIVFDELSLLTEPRQPGRPGSHIMGIRVLADGGKDGGPRRVLRVATDTEPIIDGSSFSVVTGPVSGEAGRMADATMSEGAPAAGSVAGSAPVSGAEAVSFWKQQVRDQSGKFTAQAQAQAQAQVQAPAATPVAATPAATAPVAATAAPVAPAPPQAAAPPATPAAAAAAAPAPAPAPPTIPADFVEKTTAAMDLLKKKLESLVVENEQLKATLSNASPRFSDSQIEEARTRVSEYMEQTGEMLPISAANDLVQRYLTNDAIPWMMNKHMVRVQADKEQLAVAKQALAERAVAQKMLECQRQVDEVLASAGIAGPSYSMAGGYGGGGGGGGAPGYSMGGMGGGAMAPSRGNWQPVTASSDGLNAAASSLRGSGGSSGGSDYVVAADGSVHTTFADPSIGSFSVMNPATLRRTMTAMEPPAKRAKVTNTLWA